MMGLFDRRGRSFWRSPWAVLPIAGAVILFGGIVLVNVAGQGYQRQSFRSTQFNETSQGFPASFLRGSLVEKESCEEHVLQAGDVFRTNHSAFQYTLVGNDVDYQDTPLQDCWIEEILVRNTRSLDSVLPAALGFSVKAQALMTCQNPDMQLTTEYTYTDPISDPLQQANSGNFPVVEIVGDPPNYWSQALLIYWWDQLSVNLTQANNATFNATLQTVILQARYTNESQSDINSKSTFTTSVFESNSSKPSQLTRNAGAQFSSEYTALLDKLQIPNALEFFTVFYWAIDLDLGQSASQNIFLESSLLTPATHVFHDNVFINDVFQDTPLSDGTIPPSSYQLVGAESDPLAQTNAFISVNYQCWKYKGKPIFLAIIDVVVPSVVLLALICLIFYALWAICFRRSKPNYSPVGERIRLSTPSRHQVNTSDQSFQAPYLSDDPLLTPRQNRPGTPLRNRTPDSDYFPLQRGIQDPYHETRRNSEAYELPTRPTTAATANSILETPINAVQLPFRGDLYRTPPGSAGVDDFASKMEEGHLDPSIPGWSRPVSERKSFTDLRRSGALK